MTEVSASELKILRALRIGEFQDDLKAPTLETLRATLARLERPAPSAQPQSLLQRFSGFAAATRVRVANLAGDDLEDQLKSMQRRDLVRIVSPMIGLPLTTYFLGTTGRRHVMNHCYDLRNRVAYQEAAPGNS